MMWRMWIGILEEITLQEDGYEAWLDEMIDSGDAEIFAILSLDEFMQI